MSSGGAARRAAGTTACEVVVLHSLGGEHATADILKRLATEEQVRRVCWAPHVRVRLPRHQILTGT